jgi:hypothetical protein
VAARLRDRFAAEDQPRTGEVAFLDRVGQPVVGTAGVADRRETAQQHRAHELAGSRRNVGRRPRFEFREVGCRRRHVHVRIDEARHEGHPTQVYRSRIGRHAERAVTDRRDRAVANEHRARRLDCVAVHVENVRVLEDERSFDHAEPARPVAGSLDRSFVQPCASSFTSTNFANDTLDCPLFLGAPRISLSRRSRP